MGASRDKATSCTPGCRASSCFSSSISSASTKSFLAPTAFWLADADRHRVGGRLTDGSDSDGVEEFRSNTGNIEGTGNKELQKGMTPKHGPVNLSRIIYGLGDCMTRNSLYNSEGPHTILFCSGNPTLQLARS